MFNTLCNFIQVFPGTNKALGAGTTRHRKSITSKTRLGQVRGGEVCHGVVPLGWKIPLSSW